MTTRLGPLELVGDRWTVGDPERTGGSCFVLTPDGLERRPGGATRAAPAVIPWSRFLVLHLRATRQGWMATRPMGMLNGAGYGTVGGPTACSMAGVLRDPYAYWSENYAHHRRPYDHKDIYLAGHLFPVAVKAGAARLLGDPEWVGEAVARLAELRGQPYAAAGREATGLMRQLVA
ncbi:hypothetical protein [Streptomyces avicenniae]|uniref:hypothetical protein n=1 Tax=Streptomyces avicenniae TaxID=500153 RepID=UPI00069BA2AE|nr:hypothetical protein [Streptomyces avicenniae]